MKVDYNYHTHTYRCGHAKGKDEEYVLEAIKNGFKVLGFSDHAMIPNISDTVRGDYSLLDSYIKSIDELKEKYKDKIKIYRGFEAEYSDILVPYYKELLDSKKLDYLILGQHGYTPDGMKMVYHITKDKKPGEIESYTENVIKGIKSGLFKYVCHPDLFVQRYDMRSKRAINAARKILETCKEYDMPIEINLNGWSLKHHTAKHRYPNSRFFKLAGEYQVKVIIGIDAHWPTFISEADFSRASYLIKKYNLNYIDRIKI